MSSGSSITGDAASFQLNRRSNGLSAASGSKSRLSTGVVRHNHIHKESLTFVALLAKLTAMVEAF